MINDLKKELRRLADAKKARKLAGFFKTGIGEYGEGDKFLGVMMPNTRELVKKYYRIASWNDLDALLASPWHEERMLALLMLVERFARADDVKKGEIYRFYCAHADRINNWDLVDLSAPKIVGAYLYGRDRALLFEWARSKNLWRRRIAVLATFYDIQKGEAKIALEIAGLLVNDPHDLIQKAVGWMLREIGKRCGMSSEEEFLNRHYRTMPRTMLRYAIERMGAGKRKHYLAKA